MTSFFYRLAVTFASTLIFCVPASAGIIDTVNWTNPNPLSSQVAGTGSGTLSSGAVTVAYSTISGGVGNAAVTIPENWDTSFATDGVAGGGVTNNLGGILGTTPGASPQLNTITFSSAVFDPILLVNFGDDPTSFDFGALSVTLLDSNNASLAGDVITFSGATNSSNDGFALQINGTFGPGTPLLFTYTTTRTNNIGQGNFDSVGFTVATSVVTTPEPGSWMLLGAALGAIFVSRLRLSHRTTNQI